ncbi:uncharacterized protein N7459_001413 [Penicillium hispanicum]|uniref:uncharacterized protein n=1 Tax=Penicillium hispanicum TaxID=1080232 RepID=UPI002541882F|nr:uncharacterized protein N7459_001413 [Penicillium hispanicum]KAJ5595205.1 hypothetical protein N7459_001413 [Penicillium hispanicum]
MSIMEFEPTNVDGTNSSSLPKTSDRRSSVEAPPPRFQLRKTNLDSSTNQSDLWITHRGATDEIREHLKHLGPSNLASRPRQTRYSAVKIKRGSTSPSRSAQTDFESGQSTSDSQRQTPLPGYQGGIGAGLVGSGADAKDGAHALKLGYGTISSHEHVTKGTNAVQYKEIPQVSIPEAVHEEHEDQPRSGSTRKSSTRTGSVQSSESRSDLIYSHRGPTRSGSITEQVVDVNGIRKVVLHTNGTSSSEGEGQPSPHHTRVSSPGHRDGLADPKDRNHEPAGSHSKKRRRRKKRGQQRSKPADGEPAEDQPLLQQ